MPRTGAQIPKDHTEFGGGAGLIDSVSRADRALDPEQELMEIYATNPADEKSDPATVKLERP